MKLPKVAASHAFCEVIPSENIFALPLSPLREDFKHAGMNSAGFPLTVSKHNAHEPCLNWNRSKFLEHAKASRSNFYGTVCLKLKGGRDSCNGGTPYSALSHFLDSTLVCQNVNWLAGLEDQKTKERFQLWAVNGSINAVSDVLNDSIPNSKPGNNFAKNKLDMENPHNVQTVFHPSLDSSSLNSSEEDSFGSASKKENLETGDASHGTLIRVQLDCEEEQARKNNSFLQELEAIRGFFDDHMKSSISHSPSTSSSSSPSFSESSSPSHSSSLHPSSLLTDSSASDPSPNRSEVLQSKSKNVEAAWAALVRWSRSFRSTKKMINDDVWTNTSKVTVLGGGSFGTAIAVMLARNQPTLDVVMLVRRKEVVDAINQEHKNIKYFPNHILPSNVRATTDPKEALENTQYCFHAVPVQSSTKFLQDISEFIPSNLPIFSVSKGLEVSTLEMMSELIPRALQNSKQPIVVISGPSFSIEMMDKLPTALVAASKDSQLARIAQQLLASNYLRVNTSSDVVGVEMAGALKNVLAIAAGIVEGMKLGNNCMAALVAQGCAEIRWLAEKMGGNPATLAGLSGTGDIMLTCFVRLSRNRSVGVRLGAGEKLEDILTSMNQVAEGVATAGAVIALARKYRVQMPVLTAVARILENELTPKKAVMELMSLPQVEEK